MPIDPPRLASDKWLELMSRDKKVDDGAIRFVLLERLGSAVIRRVVQSEDIAAAIAT